MPIYKPEIQQLIEKVIDDFKTAPHDNCVLWPFSRSRREKGYGTLRVNGRVIRAHIYVLTRTKGEKPEPWLQSCHSCGHSLCINPAHLRWDTFANNQRERFSHGTDNRGERCGRCKLKEWQIPLIRADNRPYSTIAPEYGVHPTQIAFIQKGKSWAWLH